MTMIDVSDIKVGLITIEGSEEEFSALQWLALCGISRENIEVKYINTAAKAPLVTLFFAEYTEVDCVYVAMTEKLEKVRERLAELELQCRMPIATTIGGVDEMNEMLNMVQLQSDMVAKADMEQRGSTNFRLN